jgi:hypothetical protein
MERELNPRIQQQRAKAGNKTLRISRKEVMKKYKAMMNS